MSTEMQRFQIASDSCILPSKIPKTHIKNEETKSLCCVLLSCNLVKGKGNGTLYYCGLGNYVVSSSVLPPFYTLLNCNFGLELEFFKNESNENVRDFFYTVRLRLRRFRSWM